MFEIEKAKIDDLEYISILAKDIYLKYNSHFDTKEGIDNVLKFISLDNIKSRNSLILQAKDFTKKIIGMIEIVNNNHISLFFVNDKYFKRGIATKLFESAINICNSKLYTVKSSYYALGFYKKLGFVQLFNDIQVVNGVHFYYMIY